MAEKDKERDLSFKKEKENDVDASQAVSL